MERTLFSWGLLASLLLLSLLAGPFFAGEVYTGKELGDFHLPARAFYAEQLAHGEPFDWMPGLFSGFYLTGEGSAATYHPVHWLLYRWLPLRVAMGWEYLGGYPLMLAGMYFFLRRRLHRRDAAMLGGLAFTFSSFNLLHFVHPDAVTAVAHIPWLLTCIDVMLVEARRTKVAWAQAAFALLTGSQLLLGCPQYVWFSLLAETAFAIFCWRSRGFRPREGCEQLQSCTQCAGCKGTSLSRVVVGKGLGLLLGAVQLLPTLDALCNSVPTTQATLAASSSLHPLNLIQLVAPYMPVNGAFHGSLSDLSLYVGAVPLMLIVWVLMRYQDLGSLRPLAVAAGALGVAGLILSMGDYSLVHRLPLLLTGLPWFPSPCHYIVLFQFAVAVLSAIGFVQLERDRREKQKLARHLPEAVALASEKSLWLQFEPLWAVVLAGAAVALAGLLLQHGPHVASASRVLVGPLLLGAAAVLVVAAAHGVRRAFIGLILLAAADLGYYGLSCTLAEPTDRLERFAASAAAPCLAPPNASCGTLGRVFAPPTRDGLDSPGTANRMTLTGWNLTDGYAELKPRRQLHYDNLAALRASSTRWVQRSPATASIAGLTPVNPDWLAVPRPLPRVRLVSHVVASDRPAEQIEGFDVDRAALCEYSVALPPGKPGSATILAERPGRILVDVRCATPQLLVVAESYHSGWKCAIDGNPQPVYRVNGDFLGCVVQPGSSHVLLDFRPDSLRRGWLASMIALSLIVGCFFIGRRR